MKNLLMVLMLSMVSVCAMAENVPFEFKVESVKELSGDMGYKIPLSDIQKGIFISLGHGLFSSGYPKTAEMVKGIFRAKGFKVVDKIEDADFGIQLPGAFDKTEEDAGEYTKAQATAKNIATDLALMALTGWGSMQKRQSSLDVSKVLHSDIEFKVVKNPTMNSFKFMSGVDEKNTTERIEMKINRLPAKGDGFQPMFLSATVIGFIEQHFDGLPASAVAAPASGVQAATPVAAN